jgi:nucleoside-diphosphate-sugar epimerase
MKQISILGCGWLGLPLAKNLLENSFAVNGSTTSKTKLPVLENLGINPFLISLSEEEISGNIISFLKNSEVLIIDIPPKLRGLEKENFVKKIQNLILFIEKALIKKVVFISSTSVYADDNSIVTEKTLPQPETESGKQLLEAEQFLLKNTNFGTIIIRFGGLIGEDRQPIKFLAGRKNIENPNASINLIHQKDCIGIILKILRQDQENNLDWNQVFNAVAPFHPNRKDYYTRKAIEMNLDLPQFNESKASVGKTVLSDNLEAVLDYHFLENNL